MSQKKLADGIVEEAIEWMVRVQSGDFSTAERQALEHWCGLSARHREAFEQLAGGLGQIKESPWRARPQGQLLRAIGQPSGRRAFLRNSLCLAGLGVGALAVSRWGGAGLALPGDYTTGTAERRGWRLEDGSKLDLNARSLVGHFDARERSLHLRQGEMLVDIAGQSRQAFQISTAAGVIESASGKLLVCDEGDSIRLVTLQAEARLALGDGPAVTLPMHQMVRFDAQGILTRAPMKSAETAWLDGWLEVRNQTLATVVQALRPYRKGIVRLDPAVAELPVSGLFSLDDSSQTLDILAHSLPIRVIRHGSYWVSIEAA